MTEAKHPALQAMLEAFPQQSTLGHSMRAIVEGDIWPRVRAYVDPDITGSPLRATGALYVGQLRKIDDEHDPALKALVSVIVDAVYALEDLLR